MQTRSINAPQPGWTLQRALDRAQGYSARHVAELSGYAAAPFLQAHLRSRLSLTDDPFVDLDDHENRPG